MNIYLAGGLKTDWQDRVMDAVPNHIYFDPRSHGLVDPREYAEWDLRHVIKSDWIFAYMERSNPTGYGMCIEIGFAYACNIPIVLVNEQPGRKWNMVHECCNYVTESFEDGIEFLKDLY